jgi:hypothetical protein
MRFYEDDAVCCFNTLRTGDADLRLYAYKQFKYPVPNVLRDHKYVSVPIKLVAVYLYFTAVAQLQILKTMQHVSHLL